MKEKSTTILRVGQGVLSIAAGRRIPGDKDTLWRNDKVQEVIKANKEASKMWETSGRQDNRDSYSQTNNAENKPVATGKARAMNE